MYAHNNVELDYFGMAYVNALLIQKHLGLTNKQITVVTDPHSLEHGKKTIGIRKIHKAFKNIILLKKILNLNAVTYALFKDTSHSKAITVL